MWPVVICPFKGENCSSHKGYLMSNLESMRKDVECTFGTLKKSWRIPEVSVQYHDIENVDKVFLTCVNFIIL
jgi:hypothetical protein